MLINSDENLQKGMRIPMIIIQNGCVIDPESKQEKITDLVISDAKITKIGNVTENERQQADKIIDATGCIVSPGLIDVHVHFRDPGFTHKEDIESGAKAALKGGYTSVILMANTKPAVDNVETLQYILNKGKHTDLHVYSCATITEGLKGEVLTDMPKLLEAGAIGFTDDGIPIMKEEVLKEAFLQSAKLQKPVSLHEEDPALISNNGVNRGAASEYFGIGGSPRDAESTLVKRDLEIAIETGAIVNIQHISTKEAVSYVREAKKRSKNIYAEATPHHFSLTEEATIEYGTLAKMNPPLRTEEDRLAIIEGLKDGTIDMIATDHAPHAAEEKAKPITEAPSGIIGLETALSLGIMNLVDNGYLSMAELLYKMSVAPADLYGLKAGRISVGETADLCIFDPNETWVAEQFTSKSQNSPFLGVELKGVVKYTITDGKIVYSDK